MHVKFPLVLHRKASVNCQLLPRFMNQQMHFHHIGEKLNTTPQTCLYFPKMSSWNALSMFLDHLLLHYGGVYIALTSLGTVDNGAPTLSGPAAYNLYLNSWGDRICALGMNLPVHMLECLGACCKNCSLLPWDQVFPWGRPCAASSSSLFWFPHVPWAEKTVTIPHLCPADPLPTPTFRAGTRLPCPPAFSGGELARDRRRECGAGVCISCGVPCCLPPRWSFFLSR